MENPFNKQNLDKEFLTLHLTDKNNQKKKYTILRRQAYASFAALTVFLSGCLYSYSLYRINTEKLVKASKQLEEVSENLSSLEDEKLVLEEKAKVLENENSVYNEELEKLKTQAVEIEKKIDELNNAKEELFDKLETVNTTQNNETSPSIPQVHTASESAFVQENEFTPIVVTPFSTVNTKTAFLSASFGQLNNQVAIEEVAYVDVSNDVTETLAFVASLPSIWPVNGQVSSEFSFRTDPINSSSAFHEGIDIRVPIGTPVKATAAGRVIAADSNKSGYGNRVEINHGNGYVTLYAHNSVLNVQSGDWVEKGDIIAYSGATGRVTGPHVHYEVLLNGELQNPRDFIK